MEQQTLYIYIIMHLGTHVPQLRSPAPQQLAPLISISGTKETRSDYTEERKKIPEIWIIILNFLKYFNFTLMCFPREKCAPLSTLLLIHLLPLCLPLLLIHLHPPPSPETSERRYLTCISNSFSRYGISIILTNLEIASPSPPYRTRLFITNDVTLVFYSE